MKENRNKCVDMKIETAKCIDMKERIETAKCSDYERQNRNS